MATQPILDSHPESTHEALLLHLKTHGECAVSDLVKVLGITSMAVRRHLSALSREGMVESRVVRQQRGRPTYRYKLSPKAEKLFPSALQALAVDLIEAVFEEAGHKGVMQLLTKRNDRMVKRLQGRFANKNLAERVDELSRIFSDDGYMTDWEALPNGDFIIYQRHCAVHELASKFRQLCVLEPRFMENLLNAKVTRQQYILKDDPVCGYLVQAK